AQVQKNQSVAALLPSLSMSAYARHTDGQQPNPDGRHLLGFRLDTVGSRSRATLVRLSAFGRWEYLNLAKNALRIHRSFERLTEQEVVFNVTNQYLQVLLDQELLRIAEENHRAQGVVLDQLREQVRLGARAEADLYTQDAQVRTLELVALRARVTLEN